MSHPCDCSGSHSHRESPHAHGNLECADSTRQWALENHPPCPLTALARSDAGLGEVGIGFSASRSLPPSKAHGRWGRALLFTYHSSSRHGRRLAFNFTIWFQPHLQCLSAFTKGSTTTRTDRTPYPLALADELPVSCTLGSRIGTRTR